MERVNTENSNSISPFDLLRLRYNIQAVRFSPKATAVSKRQVMPRIIRIFRRLWVGVGR